MNEPTDVWSLILLLLALFGGIAVFRAVRLVPRSCALIVERRGRFHAEYRAGLHLLMPFIDRERSMVDLREQEMVMSPRQVTTSDDLVVSTDVTVYFQVTDPVRATYQVPNYLEACEQLVVTTLRHVVGAMDLEQVLAGREQVGVRVRDVLNWTTCRWGVRVGGVELTLSEASLMSSDARRPLDAP